MNAILRMLAAKRRSQSEPKMVKVRQANKHRPEPAYLRAGREASAERLDYVIGCIGVIGTVGAFGWLLHDWLVVRGWM